MRARSFWWLGLVAAAGLLLAGLEWPRAAPAHVDELGRLALGLAIIVSAALAGGHAAARFGQPAVLGELLVGALLGNLPGLEALRFIGTDPYVDILARVGMLLLLFAVGLDLSVRDLFAVGPSSLLVAVIGTVASLAAGTIGAALVLPSAPRAAHVFLGAAITATSVGITARVLKDMHASKSAEARIVLGAAVVDDVLALVVLGVVSAWFVPGRIATGLGGGAMLALVMKAVGFLVLAIMLGTRLAAAWFHRAARMRTPGALLGVGLCFCFLLSWASSRIGLEALVGAFAAGLVLEDAHSAAFVQRGERSLGELLEPMTSFLVPVFFVLVGFRANLHTLAQPRLLALPLVLTLAAIAGKLACALGVVRRDTNRLAVAIGMIPRGEVTLVFAALGPSLAVGASSVLDEHGYAAIVTTVILTTIVTAPALKWSLRHRTGAPGIPRPAA
jgi:Na+:H+ antiporter